MALILMRFIFLVLLCLLGIQSKSNKGILLLYRPQDITEDCMMSSELRYDLSYGMGMSDTITLVMRNYPGSAYQCAITITVDVPNIYLILIFRFPQSMQNTCQVNRDAFSIMTGSNVCSRLCDLYMNYLVGQDAQYLGMPRLRRIKLVFMSDDASYIDRHSHYYQLTATAARIQPETGCVVPNETSCSIGARQFCFTSGVVCDGIKNCGLSDWFDERRLSCSLPVEYLRPTSILALTAVVICALIALTRILIHYLPQLATFTIQFNDNEDNRLIVDPYLKPPDRSSSSRRPSETTEYMGSSASSSTSNEEIINVSEENKQQSERVEKTGGVKTITAILQDKLKYLSGRK